MGANNTRLSPRQKMINLMYIVLTAMLALNVSSDVLDGFTQVHDGLNRTNDNVGLRNDAIYRQLEDFATLNPDKGGGGSTALRKCADLPTRSSSWSTLSNSLSCRKPTARTATPIISSAATTSRLPL